MSYEKFCQLVVYIVIIYWIASDGMTEIENHYFCFTLQLNNWFRSILSIDVKAVGKWTLEKLVILTVAKYHPTDYLLITSGKVQK